MAKNGPFYPTPLSACTYNIRSSLLSSVSSLFQLSVCTHSRLHSSRPRSPSVPRSSVCPLPAPIYPFSIHHRTSRLRLPRSLALGSSSHAFFPRTPRGRFQLLKSLPEYPDSTLYITPREYILPYPLPLHSLSIFISSTISLLVSPADVPLHPTDGISGKIGSPPI